MNTNEENSLLVFPDESNWSEGKVQSKCVQYHSKVYPLERGLLFTVNNNSDSSVQGALQTALGRVAGVSDLIYMYDGQAVCIEMKRADGKQSTAQERWQTLVTSQRIPYIVCYSYRGFVNLMTLLHQKIN